MKQLSDEIATISRNIFKKRGQIFAELMLNWPKIVGVKFSEIAHPVKIVYTREAGQTIRTLMVNVENNAIGFELNFHKELIIERMVIYFGYRVINAIKIQIGE